MPWDFLLIFFFLALILPWRGWARLQRLLALPASNSRDRLRLYVSSMTMQWCVTGLVVWRAFARGLDRAEIGLSLNHVGKLVAVSLGGAILLTSLHCLNLRRVAASKQPAADKLRAIALRILPHSEGELIVFCGLSLTAGVCEEFLYRGFVMASLHRVGLGVASCLLISSIMFGLAHAYQGKGGVVGTLLLGTVFGTARIVYDSLLPVVVWHAAIDVTAGVAGKRYLTENRALKLEESAQESL